MHQLVWGGGESASRFVSHTSCISLLNKGDLVPGFNFTSLATRHTFPADETRLSENYFAVDRIFQIYQCPGYSGYTNVLDSPDVVFV